MGNVPARASGTKPSFSDSARDAAATGTLPGRERGAVEANEEHVRELAEHYRAHFQAKSYAEGNRALEAAEALQKRLAEEHGAEYARLIDRLAYAIGHG